MDSNDNTEARPRELPTLPIGLEGFAFQTRWGPLPLPSALRPEDRGDPLMDPLTMNQLWRVALVYAASKVVPAHFQGKPDDVYIVLRMARRYKMDEHELLQNLFVVHGRPSWMTEFLVARARSQGIDIRWKVERGAGALKVQAKNVAEMTVTAYVWKDEDAGRQVTFTTQDAIDLGWTKSEQYHSTAGMENMLMWRSAARLIARYFSEIKHGLPAAEDVQAIAADEHVVEKPQVQRGAAGLAERLARGLEGDTTPTGPSDEVRTAAAAATGGRPAPDPSPPPKPAGGYHAMTPKGKQEAELNARQLAELLGKTRTPGAIVPRDTAKDSLKAAIGASRISPDRVDAVLAAGVTIELWTLDPDGDVVLPAADLPPEVEIREQAKDRWAALEGRDLLEAVLSHAEERSVKIDPALIETGTDEDLRAFCRMLS